MKRNSFIFILSLFSISSLLFYGCEDNRTEFFDEYSCIVYFLSENERELNVYLTGDEAEDTISVYKGGTDMEATTSVSLRVMSEQELNQYNTDNYTEYGFLPVNCYTVENNYDLNFSGSEHCKQIIYSINPDEINKLEDSNDSNYVIPFVLENGSDSINANRRYQFVKPIVNIPSIGFSDSDAIKLQLSDGGSVDGNLLIPVSASVANNKFEVQCTYEIDEEYLETYNEQNISNYSIMPEEYYSIDNLGTTVIETGKTATNISVKIKTEMFRPGNYYAIPLTITACSIEGYDMNIINKLIVVEYPLDVNQFTQVPLTVEMLSCNYPDPDEGVGHYDDVLDNDPATFFHSSWRGGIDDFHYWQVELPDADNTAFYFYYRGREGRGDGNWKKVLVSVSQDGETFHDIGLLTSSELPQSGDAEYTSMPFASPEPFKYVRLTQQDKKDSFFVMAEFSMWIYK